MPCCLYSTGGFPPCGGCVHFFKTTDAAVAGNVLTFTILKDTMENGEKVCIGIAQNLPTLTDPSDTTVQIALSGASASFSVITACGNYLYADQIKNGSILNTYAATDSKTLIAKQTSNVRSTYHVFPEVEPVTPATVEVSTNASKMV